MKYFKLNASLFFIRRSTAKLDEGVSAMPETFACFYAADGNLTKLHQPKLFLSHKITYTFRITFKTKFANASI